MEKWVGSNASQQCVCDVLAPKVFCHLIPIQCSWDLILDPGNPDQDKAITGE